MTNNLKNIPIEERLRNYISHLSDVIKGFQENNRKYLEMNIILITISIALLSLLFNNLIDIPFSHKIIIFIPLAIYLVLSGYTIIYNSLSNTTKYRTPKNPSHISRWLKKKFSKPGESLPSSLWHFSGILPKLERRKDFELDCKKFCNKIKHYSGLKHIYEFSKFIKDDIKEIFILSCYQENYYKIAIQTQKFTLRGFLFFTMYVAAIILFLLLLD